MSYLQQLLPEIIEVGFKYPDAGWTRNVGVDDQRNWVHGEGGGGVGFQLWQQPLCLAADELAALRLRAPGAVGVRQHQNHPDRPPGNYFSKICPRYLYIFLNHLGAPPSLIGSWVAILALRKESQKRHCCSLVAGGSFKLHTTKCTDVWGEPRKMWWEER